MNLKKLLSSMLKLQKQKWHKRGPGPGHKMDTKILLSFRTATHLFQYSLHNWLLWFSGLKEPHLFSFQAKWVQCFTSLPLYNQVHCYLFCWQLLVLLACQRKAKTTRSSHLANGTGRKDGLKTKTD